MDLVAGTVISDKYELLAPLARGGMGAVWTARHVKLGSRVAVKFIDPVFAQQSAFLARFEREARAAAAIESPHIVQVRDYGVERGTPYLVMELLQGEDLGARLHRAGRLSLGGDCSMGKCAATCIDTQKDQDETDVDCGGAIYAGCANTLGCAQASDCQSGFCNGMMKCAACVTDVNCQAGGMKYCNGGTCAPDKPAGQPCAQGTQCLSGFCTDGVCCGAGSCGTCQACNVAGSVGVCETIAAGQQGHGCNGAGQACDANGACKVTQGQTCAGDAACLSGHCADTVCCNAACPGTCTSCNIAGSVGVCTNVNSGQSGKGCAAPLVCDGMANCKTDKGQTCAGDAACLTGHCADTVCCNAACFATCQACNVAGNLGTCTNIPNGQQDSFPANACVVANNQACDGNGNCLKDNGQVCGANTDCVSNFCVDGYCCNSSCTTTCMTCGLVGSFGTCSNITADVTDSFPANACVGVKACNGSGACLSAPGQGCLMNAECASAVCSKNNGMAGVCLKLAGEACGGPTECISNSCMGSVCQ